MLGDIEVRTPWKSLFVIALVLVLLLGLDHYTGFLTTMHLKNEEELALKHGRDSALYTEMLAELVQDTRSTEHWKRQLAAVELGHLGSNTDNAIAALEQLLGDSEPGVRMEAAIALARIGKHTGKAVGPLTEILRTGSDHEKYLAARSLGMIGRAADPAVPLLLQEVITGHADVADAARQALAQIDTEAARQALHQAGAPAR